MWGGGEERVTLKVSTLTYTTLFCYGSFACRGPELQPKALDPHPLCLLPCMCVPPTEVPNASMFWESLLGDQFQGLQAAEMAALGRGKRERAKVRYADQSRAGDSDKDQDEEDDESGSGRSGDSDDDAVRGEGGEGTQQGAAAGVGAPAVVLAVAMTRPVAVAG